jgi:hypothetical protein
MSRGREEDGGIMTKSLLSTKNILLQITSNTRCAYAKQHEDLHAQRGGDMETRVHVLKLN